MTLPDKLLKKIVTTAFIIALLTIPLNLFSLTPAPTRAAGVVGNGTPASCTEAALDTALTGGGLITFNCGPNPLTILLTSQKNLLANTTLDGGNLITLSGNNATRLFVITSGVSFTVRNLSLINGNATTSPVPPAGLAIGSAVYNNGGFLTMENCTVANHAVTAIFLARNSPATFNNCLFTANTAIRGSAIDTDSPITINNSTFLNNRSNGEGGAIALEFVPYTAIINNTTFSGNTVGINGGAIEVEFSVTLNVSGSTFFNNTAGVSGGAIDNSFGATVNLTNSTFVANTAPNGGALANNTNGGTNDGRMNIVNSSFSANSANSGGAIFNNTATGLTLANSIVASSPNGGNCAGTILNNGNNLQWPGTSCGLTIPALDPQLGSLANNGGPTQTLALLPASPAIDQANNASCPATDQRGLPRPVDGNKDGTATCDIGAFELQVTILPTPTPTTTPGATATPTPTSTPDPGATRKTGGLPAELIPQLRVTPDRLVSTDSTNLISYTLTIKNTGRSKATHLSLHFPIDSALEVGYASFNDSRSWVSQVVTGVAQLYLVLSFPDLEPNATPLVAVLVFRPGAQAASHSEVFTRYQIYWDDDEAAGKTQASNGVRYHFSSDNTNRDETGGEVQLFDPVNAILSKADELKIRADFYIPGEPVNLWYTDQDGTSYPLPTIQADATGNLIFEFEAQNLKVGETYTLAGRGSRSEITGSLVLVVQP
jgi:hypothetical protein